MHLTLIIILLQDSSILNSSQNEASHMHTAWLEEEYYPNRDNIYLAGRHCFTVQSYSERSEMT